MRKFLPVALLLVACSLLSGPPARSQGPAGLGTSPLEPASTGGLPLVDRALAKLTQHRRLLVVGAHPDDEDTSALALVARGQGGEAAYLSLSRGEGGQNLIGPELGVTLGLLRSRELLAARQVDGARQFFTRAYDFGYTRSLDETLEKWPREVLLEDAVRVIRRFRPQVVVSVFPADERGGHGQHQAAGWVAHEAFERAGERGSSESADPPWSPSALFRATWWDEDATTLETELGRVDPLTGRSYFQVAMASRSMHRSQDMGRIQPLGPAQGRYAWVAGPGGAESDDLFSGMDTRLEAIAALLPEGPERAAAGRELAAARELAEATRAGLAPGELEAAAGGVVTILGHLRAAHQAALRAEGEGAVAAAELLEEKLAVARTGLLAAAGVAVDAWAERATVAAGDSLRVEAVAWHAAGSAENGLPVVPVGVFVTGTQPWQTSPAVDDEAKPVAPPAGALAPGDLATWGFHVAAPSDAVPTVPYFLERPLAGALYDWSPAPPAVRGEPFGPPPLVVRFLLRVGGEEVRVEREVVERQGDQAVGEVRRPLRVVPRVAVAIEPELLVWSTADGEAPTAGARPVKGVLRSHVEYPLAGLLRLEVPEGWAAPEPVRFEIAEPRGEAAVVFPLAAPADLPRGRYVLRAVAELGPSLSQAASYPVVDYPHIRATPYRDPAELEVAAAEIRLPDLDRVGFLTGVSDRVPAALAAVGVPIRRLSGRDLAEMSAEELDRFDAVVVGSRAYETDRDLARANPRLLDYARRGGLVLVLYQQYPFVEGEYAPYPLEIARPHDRVTEEEAPVTVLAPEHPALTRPNRIGGADWEGWVQERGLYFARTWDEAYVPLLSFPASPGYEPGEVRGGLLVAEVGEGTWVYTGLAFFRQLPAGVTGAYRLFANLLALEAGE